MRPAPGGSAGSPIVPASGRPAAGDRLDPGSGRLLQSTPRRATDPLSDSPGRCAGSGVTTRRMTRRYVNQLAHGDSIDEVFLVADKQLRANRQGNLYLQLELRDKTGSVGARLWNATEELLAVVRAGRLPARSGARPRSSRARSRSSSRTSR